MDQTKDFLTKLEDIYSEKYRLYDSWVTTGDTGLHMTKGRFLSNRTAKAQVPFKSMLLSMYGIDGSATRTETVTSSLGQRGILIPKIIITPPEENEDLPVPCLNVKEAPKKKSRWRQVMRWFAACVL